MFLQFSLLSFTLGLYFLHENITQILMYLFLGTLYIFVALKMIYLKYFLFIAIIQYSIYIWVLVQPLPDFLIKSSNLSVKSFGFSMQVIMSSMNNDSFVFVIPIFIAFILLNTTVWLVSPPMLNRNYFYQETYFR